MSPFCEQLRESKLDNLQNTNLINHTKKNDGHVARRMKPPRAKPCACRMRGSSDGARGSSLHTDSLYKRRSPGSPLSPHYWNIITDLYAYPQTLCTAFRWRRTASLVAPHCVFAFFQLNSNIQIVGAALTWVTAKNQKQCLEAS